MDNFRQFIAKYPVKTFKKGETILLSGEMPKSLHIIESGYVKTYSITKIGSERLVSIDKPGEEFPIGYTFSLIDHSDYFYEAFTNCNIRFVPKDEYLEYLNLDVDRMKAHHTRIASLLLSTLSHIHALEQPSAGEKIASTLVYMAEQFGVKVRPYRSQVRIVVTQQEIADSLGVSRETVNIELKKLESQGLILCSRKSYILHVDKLSEFLDKR